MSEKQQVSGVSEIAEAAVWITLFLCCTFLIKSCADGEWLEKDKPTTTTTTQEQ
jgi:hypothetical protein